MSILAAKAIQIDTKKKKKWRCSQKWFKQDFLNSESA
jgi:hypothetical protein